MDLHHVADGFPGSQHIVHAAVALGAAVAYVRDVVVGGKAAVLDDAPGGRLGQAVEMHAAWVAVAVNVLHQHLRFDDVLFLPAGSHFQRVELRP